MMIVEIGIKLNKDFEYYDKTLKDNGFINVFKITTYDIYYTDKILDNLSENEIKESCIRLRSHDKSKYKIQNCLIDNFNEKEISNNELNDFENKISKLGYRKIFNTQKNDFHYYKNGMSSKIQLQNIKDIGLLLYYDNKDYYKFEEEEQRKMLIDELNSYGFDFDYNKLGLDKLRTLYYQKEMFSNNQNA